MDYRQLGRSGLRVSSLALGTNTFGGQGIFRQLGSTDVPAATRLIDISLDAGVNLFDTADEYSGGLAEETLGAAVKGRRDRVLLATKVRTATGDGPNDSGLSRHHLIRACEASLRRLNTDYIDLYQLHGWDGQTAEVVRDLVEL
jgi:aryl-alcohol dehydrogenase-like predicted oxidoreductase